MRNHFVSVGSGPDSAPYHIARLELMLVTFFSTAHGSKAIMPPAPIAQEKVPSCFITTVSHHAYVHNIDHPLDGSNHLETDNLHIIDVDPVILRAAVGSETYRNALRAGWKGESEILRVIPDVVDKVGAGSRDPTTPLRVSADAVALVLQEEILPVLHRLAVVPESDPNFVERRHVQRVREDVGRVGVVPNPKGARAVVAKVGLVGRVVAAGGGVEILEARLEVVG